MDELTDYLRSRHVPEEDIQRMEQDKIDSSVIRLMTDDQLSHYLPSYGDRLAVFGYCRRKDKDPSTRKSKLFERLRGKVFRQKGDREHVPEREHQTSLRNAQKNQRKIELGWMHFREGEFVQVRTKKGGGTRKESVPKGSKKQQLIEKAGQLFFPGGKNAEGNLTDFDIDLTDYQQYTLEDSITVGELYEKTKLPVLRFYLTTKKRVLASDTDQELNSVTAAQESEKTHDTPDHSHTSSTPKTDAVEINASDVIYVGSNAVFPNESSESVSLLCTTTDSSVASGLPEYQDVINLDALEDSSIITFHTESISGMEYPSLEDTFPLSRELSAESPLPHSMDMLQEPIAQKERVKKVVVLHRGQILRELITVFCEQSILEDDIYFKVILPDGRLEMAVDDGGVLRDVLSEFWNDFYEQCTMGNSFKVPYLRHDFGKQEWESIGRIIKFGWQKERYLPVKLSPVLLEQAVFGSVESDLVDSFFKYVSASERVIFESCCSDFEGVDQEELLEIMDIHSCRRIPTADNIEQILRELAHQNLIQEPAFVIEQWSSTLVSLRSELKGIAAVYEGLQPTSRKIMKGVIYPSILNAQENQIVKL
uniref:uncharacterized protein LOC109968716 n=1 Tax=Monopterus albus TaxID=43700 RepID=UPI0009B419E7|nr:uncharacterized protein LOC109968716 [Monopterus albus]